MSTSTNSPRSERVRALGLGGLKPDEAAAFTWEQMRAVVETEGPSKLLLLLKRCDAADSGTLTIREFKAALADAGLPGASNKVAETVMKAASNKGGAKGSKKALDYVAFVQLLTSESHTDVTGNQPAISEEFEHQPLPAQPPPPPPSPMFEANIRHTPAPPPPPPLSTMVAATIRHMPAPPPSPMVVATKVQKKLNTEASVAVEANATRNTQKGLDTAAENVVRPIESRPQTVSARLPNPEHLELQAAAEAEVQAAMAAATGEESPTLKPSSSTLSPVLEGHASSNGTESGSEFKLETAAAAAADTNEDNAESAAAVRLAAAANSFAATAATRASSVERTGWDRPSVELAEKLAVRAKRLADYERMSQERPGTQDDGLQQPLSNYGDDNHGDNEPIGGELDAHEDDEKADTPKEFANFNKELEDEGSLPEPAIGVHANNNKSVANTTSLTSQSELPASAYLNGTEGLNGGRLHVHAKFLAAAKTSALQKGGVGPNPAAPSLPSINWSYANGHAPRVQGLIDRTAFKSLVYELAADLMEIGAVYATPEDSVLDSAYDTATHTPKMLRLGGYMNEAAFLEAAAAAFEAPYSSKRSLSTVGAASSNKGSTISSGRETVLAIHIAEANKEGGEPVSNEVTGSSDDDEVGEPPIPALVPAGVPPLVPLSSHHTEEANPLLEDGSGSSSGDEDDRERFLPGHINDVDEEDDDEGYRGDGSKKRSQRIRFILDPRGASVSSLDHSSVERSASIDRAAKRPKGPVWANFKPKRSNELSTTKTTAVTGRNGLFGRSGRSSLDRGSAPGRNHNDLGPVDGLPRNANGRNSAANNENPTFSQQPLGHIEETTQDPNEDSPQRHLGGNFASIKPWTLSSNHQQAPEANKSPLLGNLLSPPGGGLRGFPRTSNHNDANLSSEVQHQGTGNRVVNKRTPFSFAGPLEAAPSVPKEQPTTSTGRVPNRFRGAARTPNRFVEGESASADVLKEKHESASVDEAEYLDGEEEAEDVEDASSARFIEQAKTDSNGQQFERLPNESAKEQSLNQGNAMVLQRDQSWRESLKPFFTPFQWPTSQLLLQNKESRAEGGPPPRGSVRRLENHILLWEHCGGWDDDSLLTSYTPEEAAAANAAASIAEAKAMAHARVMNKIAPHAQEARSGDSIGGRVRSNSRARRESRRLKTLRPRAPFATHSHHPKPTVRRATKKPVNQNKPEWASLTLPLPRFQNAPASQVLAAKVFNEQKLLNSSDVQDRDTTDCRNDSFHSVKVRDIEAETRALASLVPEPPSKNPSPQTSHRSASPALLTSCSSQHFPSSSQGRSHLPQFMAPPHWHAPPRPKPASPALEMCHLPPSSSLPLAWRSTARQGMFQIESRTSRRASTDLDVMPSNRSNEMVPHHHQLEAPNRTHTWDAIREHIAAAKEAKETRQLPSFLRRRRTNTAPNVPFLSSRPLRSSSHNDNSLGQSFDGCQSTEGTSFESGLGNSIDSGSVVWNSGRKVLLRAPAPSQDNDANEGDAPRPNLESSTGDHIVNVDQDDDNENAPGTPPRDSSGARLTTPVRGRSDDSISSNQSSSPPRTSSWFNKTKAVVSLWRKRDEDALRAAAAPPVAKRPIVRVRQLGGLRAQHKMPPVEPRHSSSIESIMDDSDDRGRRLRAFLGDRDGDGRNVPRSMDGADLTPQSSSMNKAESVSDHATQAARSMRNYSIDVVTASRSQEVSPSLPVEASERSEEPTSTKSAAPSPPPLSQDLLRSPGRSARIPFAGGSTAERLALTRTNSGLRHTTMLSDDDCSESVPPPPPPLPTSSSPIDGASGAKYLAELSAWEARNTERLAALRTPQSTTEDVNGGTQ